MPLLLIRLVIFGSPFAAARAGRKCPQDRAHDAREFVARIRDVRSTNPGLTSRTAAGSAASGVCSLWSLSLAQARESDPRAGRARKTGWTRSD